MKVELDIRNKVYKKTVAVVALMLAWMVAMFAVGLSGRDWFLLGVALLSIPVFVYLLYALLWPGKWNCMRLVKGEMTYRELKDAIAREDFEEPIRFLKRDWLKTCVFQVSDSWALMGEGAIYDDPVCIPKDRVRAIEVGASDLGRIDDLWDQDDDPLLDLDDKTFYAFELVCDEKNSFISGFIAPDDLDAALTVLRKHFPQAGIKESLTEGGSRSKLNGAYEPE